MIDAKTKAVSTIETGWWDSSKEVCYEWRHSSSIRNSTCTVRVALGSTPVTCYEIV